MANRSRLLATVALLLGAVALSGFATVQSLRWLDAETPGFFLDPTRHVSLLSLPGWPDTRGQWPSSVTRADGIDVIDPDHLYQMVRSKPDGAQIAYETSRLGIAGAGFTAGPRVLSRGEFAALFLALVVNGLATILIAVWVWFTRPGDAASAFLIAGVSIGVLALTSVTVVADGSLARVNILAQSLTAAGILHLALVYPANLLPRAKIAAMFAVYTPFAALALIYQLTWPDTFGTGLMHGIATGAIVLAVGALLLSMVLRLARQPILVHRRAAIGLSGVAGVAAAAAVWGAVAGFEWRVVAAAVFTAGACVPLAIGTAIAARDFFALDERLRAIITYAVAVPAGGIAYAAALYAVHQRAPESLPPLPAIAPFAAVHLALVVALVPGLRFIRSRVDRFFSPKAYSAERSITHLNRGLSSARTTQTLVANTLEILKRTLGPKKATVLLRSRGAGFALFAYDDQEQRKIAVPSELADQLESDEKAIRYQWDGEANSKVAHFLDRLAADLLMPVYRNGACVGVIALSAKESGRPYDVRDIAFLRTAANQIALALPNAAAQDKLDVLYKNLDELTESLRVQTNRTETLKAMNAELGQALHRLRETHLQLGENHQAILRAERRAALTRLSIGLTQEISGPLGAVLNSLRGIARIGAEQTDGARTPEKQREAIAEMLGHAQNGATWLERTIGYLRSFQALGRGVASDQNESFALRDAFTEVTQLLRLRLRESGCVVTYSESPDALQLYGSRQLFALILVDLVTAAMQAYSENQTTQGNISVEAELTSQGISLHVVDWAGGLPAAAIPRLLDQLGDDELVGNRRGLWMAKNLVEEGFGGTLEVVTNDERTCFTAVFPAIAEKLGPMEPPPSTRRAAND
jgi:GAF domain-containing protein